MDESAKDQVEFLAAHAAAGVLEIFPGGSLLSKGLLVPLELAERRRTAKILAGLQEDIEGLQAAGKLNLTLDELANSDRFMASLTEAMRASKATSDESKRKLLRNAVINSEINPHDGGIDEFFMRLVGRYSTLHVRILRLMEGLPAYVSDEESYPVVDGQRTGVMRDVPALVRSAYPEHLDMVIPALQDLRNDGMLVQTQPQTYGLQNTGDPSRPDTISPLGEAFVGFLRDPMEGG